ncbi:MAG: insulinase family protein [Gemmatimonadetes bacterium]|nr:insulinase family protein [Gemmatimonadota bacterium]
MRAISPALRGIPPLLAGWLLATAAAEAQEVSGDKLPVVEQTLPNGMRFLVLERPGAPTVSFIVHFDVGSVNEALGYTGIAHMLEHMLFKGTTTVGTRSLGAELAIFPSMDAVNDSILRERARPERADSARIAALARRLRALEDSARALAVPNEFDLILTRSGARGLNAATDMEGTYYFVELPANRAQLWFVMEADRMANPVFREFYTERDVVAEERRMRVETQPGSLLSEALLAAAYRVHPYGVPVVGHMSDIQSFSRRQVEEYYRRYYGPSNAVVAIVGDIAADSILAWADRYFRWIPAGEKPRPVLAEEPPQRGERRVEVAFDAEPQLMVGWHVASEAHPDDPALSVLASILTGGRTTRLYRRMVLEERIAAGVTSSLIPGDRYPALFVVSATPRAPHTTAELERVIYQELDRLKAEPPAPVEVQRVRNQIEAGEVRRLRSNFGLAFQLAESATRYGDWRATFRLGRRLQAVEPEDIRRVAQRYFSRENRTVATLVRPAGERTQREARP